MNHKLLIPLLPPLRNAQMSHLVEIKDYDDIYYSVSHVHKRTFVAAHQYQNLFYQETKAHGDVVIEIYHQSTIM